MHPSDRDDSSVPTVFEMVDRLIDDEVRTRGVPRRLARRPVAHRIGLSPGTIENIQRDRLKFVERVESKIRAAFIRLLESEIAKATHELEISRRIADRSDAPSVIKARADLQRRVDEAQRALGAPRAISDGDR